MNAFTQDTLRSGRVRLGTHRATTFSELAVFEIMVTWARMNDTRVFGKRGDVNENNVETGFLVFTDPCRNVNEAVKVISVTHIQ